MRRTAILLSAAAFVWIALSPLPAEARGAKRATESLDEAPAWVQEAYARKGGGGGAGLVWLHRELVVEPLEEGGRRMTRRLALRVTSKAGLDEATQFGETYEEGEDVPEVRCWTIDPDGQVVRPDIREDYDDLPIIQDFSIYEDTRYRMVAPPSVSVGSVVAVETQHVRERDWGNTATYLGVRSAPTLYARFELALPERWAYGLKTRRLDGFSVSRADGRLVIEGHSLNALPRKLREAPSFEVMPSVDVHWWSPDGSRGFRNWQELGRAMHELTAPVLAESTASAARGAGLRPATEADFLSALADAFDVAAREVRYVSVQVGIGGFRPYPPDEVLDKRYGDCKGKTFLMRALASPWGATSYPVFVRTRDLGPLEEDVPGPGQFDHMIAAFRLPDGVEASPWASAEVEGLGRLLFVDPTAHASGVLELPWSVQGTRALVVLPDGGRLVDLPVRPAGSHTVERRVDGEVDAEGVLTRAEVVERWSGSAASSMRAYLLDKDGEERQRWLEQRSAAVFSGAVLGEHSLSGLDDLESDVELRYTLRGTRAGAPTAGLIVVEPGGVARGVVYADLPRKLPDGCDYRPGTPRSEVVRVSLRLPDGYVPEALPRASAEEADDLEFDARWRFEEGVLHYERDAALHVIEVPGERYRAFRDRVRSLAGADRQGIVLVPESQGG